MHAWRLFVLRRRRRTKLLLIVSRPLFLLPFRERHRKDLRSAALSIFSYPYADAGGRDPDLAGGARVRVPPCPPPSQSHHVRVRASTLLESRSPSIASRRLPWTAGSPTRRRRWSYLPLLPGWWLPSISSHQQWPSRWAAGAALPYERRCHSWTRLTWSHRSCRRR